MRSATFPLPLAALAALSCGGGPGGSVAIDDFPAEYREAVCSLYGRCLFGGDQALCRRSLVSLDRDVAQVVASVKAGKARYDAAAARVCLDAFAASSCDRAALDRWEAVNACEGTFQGTVAPGGSCFSGTECADRGTCEKRNCSGQGCCAGTCKARAPAGTPGSACQQAAECVDSAFCSRSGAAGVCQPRVPLGAACVQAGDCVAGADCQGAAGARRCAAWVKDGQPCAADRDCASISSMCHPTDRTCRPRASVGAACTAGGCIAQADCVEGRCQRRPTLGENCTAGPDGGTGPVGPGLRCLAGACTAGLCTLPPPPPVCQ